MKGETTTKDHGAARIRALMKQIRAQKPYVSVGVLGDKAQEAKKDHDGKEGALTLVQVATYNEMGTETIPSRPFIRGTGSMHKNEIKVFTEKLYQQVLHGKRTIPDALERLGEYVRGLIRRRIQDGIPPANAQSTIARKGSSKPLIDTGQLVGGINYQVHEEGK
jgi:hypothetical protein